MGGNTIVGIPKIITRDDENTPPALTLLYGESNNGITGNLFKNRLYQVDITIPGAEISDRVKHGVNTEFLNEIDATDRAWSSQSAVVAPDTVRVTFRLQRFIGASTNRKVWAEILK